MGKITNRTGLPEALARAMENDPYSNDGSHDTPSLLNKPIQLRVLEERYGHEIQEDAEDGLYRLYGQIAHGILERANGADLAEKRYFMEVGGRKVSAQIDTLSIKDGVLSDYKFTTSYGFWSGKSPKTEWVNQLNLQAELLRRHGHTINKLQIVGLLRDWQIREAKTKPDYPQAPIAVIDIPMWSSEQVMAWVELRISEYLTAINLPDEMLPECSFEERYAGKESWAVVKNGKNGKARAIPGGVQYSQELAESICEKNPGTRVEYRREEPTKRCQLYCKVSAYCKQFKRLAGESQTDDNKEKIG